ncbi:hypothetical protein C5748_10685 [Phyllobacterium phragmitis]|uniref:Xylose isomerase-like TIM barrel domain-containing protein n=1 Tax=Phyllobacterium phragmitis TaxID=2670329 RepID=A0A2S9IT44_9HYPH|nr:TIM barrel protein [Phyllobacterium phragmitis]PRD43704.1 hypothetical protein C5748_10685 [Phyllobacterium phragmitis]
MSAVRIGLVDWRLPVSGPHAVLLAARLGAEGIQLDLGGPGRAPWLDGTERLSKLHVALSGSGVMPLAVAANMLNDLGLTAKDGTALADQVRRVIIRTLNVAVELGAALVFLPSFRCSTINSPSALARTVEVLRWACAEAQQKKLLLATENVLAPQQLQQLVELVDSPNLRIVLDTGNTSTEGLDPVAVLQTAGRVLANQVHIKNSNDHEPLSVEDSAVLDTLTELSRASFTVDALVLENDYRDGELNRVKADLKWLRNHLAAYPINHHDAL